MTLISSDVDVSLVVRMMFIQLLSEIPVWTCMLKVSRVSGKYFVHTHSRYTKTPHVHFSDVALYVCGVNNGYDNNLAMRCQKTSWVFYSVYFIA